VLGAEATHQTTSTRLEKKLPESQQAFQRGNSRVRYMLYLKLIALRVIV